MSLRWRITGALVLLVAAAVAAGTADITAMLAGTARWLTLRVVPFHGSAS